MLTYLIIGGLTYFYFLLFLPTLYSDIKVLTYPKAIRNLYLFVLYVYLFFVTIFRSLTVGTDYSMYYRFYINGNYSEYFDPFINLIYRIAVNEGHFLIFTVLVTFLFLFLNVIAMKKLSRNLYVSLTLFILSFYYLLVFNGMRQAIAIAIIFLGLYFLQKEQLRTKDIIIYCLFIIIAMQFHFSAIFIGFIIIILRFFKLNKYILTLGLLLTVLGYFTPYIKDLLTGILLNFDFYANKYSGNLDFFFEVKKEKSILQFIPVLVQYVFLYIGLYLTNNKTSSKFFINYYFIFLLLYSGSGIEAIDRLQFYFYPSIILFYDLLIYLLINKDKENKITDKFSLEKTIIFLSISFWFVYFIVRVLQGTQGIIPYEFIDNNY